MLLRVQRRARHAGSALAGATTSCWSTLRTSVATELEPHLAHSHFGKGRGHDWIISGETEQPFRDVVPNNELDQLRARQEINASFRRVEIDRFTVGAMV